MTEEKNKKKKTSKIYKGCLIVFLIILGIIIFFFYLFFETFGSSRYKENTKELIENTSTRYLSSTKLIYPEDAEIIHVSSKKLGPNFSTNSIFSVKNIDLFIDNAQKKYKFKNLKMNYPKIGNNENYDVMISDLCGNLNQKDYQVKNPDSLKNFCGERNIMISHVKKELEHVIIMVILPDEKLIWVNDTGWF